MPTVEELHLEGPHILGPHVEGLQIYLGAREAMCAACYIGAFISGRIRSQCGGKLSTTCRSPAHMQSCREAEQRQHICAPHYSASVMSIIVDWNSTSCRYAALGGAGVYTTSCRTRIKV